MAVNTMDHAQLVADKFKELLGPDVRGKISDTQYRALVVLVREAIAAEMNQSAEQIEALAKQMRANLQKPDLAL